MGGKGFFFIYSATPPLNYGLTLPLAPLIHAMQQDGPAHFTSIGPFVFVICAYYIGKVGSDPVTSRKVDVCDHIRFNQFNQESLEN